MATESLVTFIMTLRERYGMTAEFSQGVYREAGNAGPSPFRCAGNTSGSAGEAT